MARARWIDWRELLLQLIVVFVGLLAALWVDDWKDERQARQTETLYLRRLAVDLHEHAASLDSLLRFLEPHRRAVQHVSDSLAAGRILGDDTRLFEQGLIYVAHLPSIAGRGGTYNEMLASGAFARLRSPELQGMVSELYATEATVDANFAWWRAQPERVEALIQPAVEYYTEGTDRSPSPELKAEEGRRVRFDFERLRSQVEIRNGFYWAADTHSDWVEWITRVREQARRAESIVRGELERRDH